MQDIYEAIPERGKPAKKGLTWAEYSIIVALLFIIGALAYGWNVKKEAEKVKVEMVIARKMAEDARAEKKKAEDERDAAIKEKDRILVEIGNVKIETDGIEKLISGLKDQVKDLAGLREIDSRKINELTRANDEARRRANDAKMDIQRISGQLKTAWRDWVVDLAKELDDVGRRL